MKKLIFTVLKVQRVKKLVQTEEKYFFGIAATELIAISVASLERTHLNQAHSVIYSLDSP